MIQLSVEKLVAGGEGMGRLDGKVVFLSYTAPGDLVRARITREKKGFSRAEVTEILEPSPLRVEPFCPHYESCGGCNLQHLQYKAQLEGKKQIFQETFKRMARQELPEINLFHGPDKAYRNRVQFHRSPEGGWGFRRRGSHQVEVLEECPLLKDACNRFLQDSPNTADETDRIQVFADDLHYYSGGEKEIKLKLLDKEIHFHSSLFFQSNVDLLESFIPYITEQQTGRLFLDLFGGVGLFSLFLQDHFQEGIHLESNRAVKEFARQNLQPNVSSVLSPLEDWKGPTETPDLMVVDPPRSGIHPRALSRMIRWKAPRIVYVSCDPVTQARDSKVLLEAGYKIRKAALFDFYPHTSHMESVIHFEA